MAATKKTDEEQLQELVGLRTDVDLDQRWWHRVAKVAYFVVVATNILLLYFISDAVTPEAKAKNVTIKETLGSFLSKANPAVGNVVPSFLALPGKLGQLYPATGDIEVLPEYYLRTSWCSSDAYQHLDAIVDYLNGEYPSSTVTAASVTASIQQAVGPTGNARVCWFDKNLRGLEMNNAIKYEFTISAVAKRWFDILLYVAIAHIVLLNVYYRGFVYIIVGPRKKTTPSI